MGHDKQDATSESLLTGVDLVPDHALGQEDLDAFGHGSIAARVAELVVHATTPLNIGLFGAWGAGKSSSCELLCRELDRSESKRIRVVSYEAAWKFGGVALERNFISHVARELRLDEGARANREFYRGLYESRRSAEIDLARVRESGSAVVATFVGALLAGFGILLALLGVVAWLSDTRTWSGLLDASLPALLTSSALVAFISALTAAILTGVRVDIDQTQPADEELSAIFERLVSRILARYDRVVFFIDELDRCSAEDVVATLATIKNFLGHQDCIFIIAADRSVLEKALNKLPQETPSTAEAPYYSTASAFLDKMFQHQISLPPLRPRRLSRFAQELVAAQAEQGGLWFELAASDSTRRDDVIYALIPSHISSPRRVKVLLNNFATNTRIAQARGIDYLTRASEIAKLTVLETEFPLLAADLHLEPRLPTAVLEAMDSPSPAATDAVTSGINQQRRGPRLERLVRRHVFGPGDRLMVGDSADRAALTATRSDELKRYLQRTAAAGIPDPAGDLLYLEGAGAAVGLEDSDLAEFIERVATDSPRDVISRVIDASEPDELASALLLSHMADESFGSERTNIITTLVGICDAMGAAAAPVARRAAHAVRSFLREPPGELHDESLTAALTLARLAERGGASPLTDLLFADPRLLQEAERVKSVTQHAPSLAVSHRQQLYQRIAELFPEDRNVLFDVLPTLPANAAVSLLRAQPVSDAVVAGLDADDSDLSEADDGLAVGLLRAARNNADDPHEVELAAQWLILKSGASNAYAAAFDSAQNLLPEARSDVVASHVLRGLELAPPGDWSAWHALLPPQRGSQSEVVSLEEAVVGRVIEQVYEAPPEPQVAGRELVHDLILHLSSSDADKSWRALLPTIDETLNSHDWWTSAETRSNQEALHFTIREVSALSSAAAAHVDDALLKDIRRSLSTPTHDALVGAGIMGQLLAKDSAADVTQLLDELYTTDDGADPDDHEVTLARARLAAGAYVSEGSVPAAFELDLQKLSSAVSSRSDAGSAAFEVWLETKVQIEQVKRLIVVSRLNRRAVRAVGRWAQARTPVERTQLILELADARRLTQALAAAIAEHPVDDERVVQAFSALLEKETNAPGRARWVRLIDAVRPQGGAAQALVASVMIQLLNRDTAVDFKNAQLLAPSLMPENPRKRSLEKAWRTAVAKRRLTRRGANALERAGIGPWKERR